MDGLRIDTPCVPQHSLLEHPNLEEKQQADFEELVSGSESMVQDATSKLSSCLESKFI